MDAGRYADLFLAESREHLTAMNHLLLQWERDPAAPEPVDGVFRAVHTLKGMAATMGYAGVADLAHRAENLLDVLRRTPPPVGPSHLDLLFRAADALERGVADAVAGGEDDPSLAALGAELDAEVARVGPPPGGGRLVLHDRRRRRSSRVWGRPRRRRTRRRGPAISALICGGWTR